MSICATIGKPIITGIDTCIHDGFVGFSELNEVDKEFLYYILKNLEKRFISLSQTGSQANLNTDLINNAKVHIPSIEEQKKIVSLISTIDSKIDFMEKKYIHFTYYKRSFIQSLPLTCKEDLKIDNWSFISLSDCMNEHKTKSSGNEEVYSVSVYKGLINQIEHLGRSYSAEDTSKYNLVKPGDIVYTKSPTGNFPLGIIKQSHLNKNVIVSPLYGVFTPTTYELGYIIEAFFESPIQCNNYLHPLVQKGAKNTMNITNKTFLSKKIHLPTDIEEQKRIYQVIKTINEKLKLTKQEIENNKNFKKSLLSKMFC